MSEDKVEPQPLDPALLAEIEAEFADLTREIERISLMPRSQAPQKTVLLEALRSSWRTRLETLGNRPEWRQRLETTIGNAVDRLLEDGLSVNPDGSLAFNLRGDTLQSQGGPILRGLMDGLSHMLEEKFPPPKATAAAPDAPPTPPLPPMQALLGNLGQVLAGALKNAVAGSGGRGPEVATKATDGGTAVEVSVTTTPPDPATPGTGVQAEVDIRGNQDVSASFVYDTRMAAPGGQSAPPAGAPAAPASPGAGANAFFQQLIQGFGQALKQAVAPKTPEAPKPAEAAPAAGPEAQAAAPSAPAPAAPNPLAGLGAILAQALQKVLASSAANTAAPAAPVPPAASAPPSGEVAPGVAGSPPDATTPAPAAAPADAAPPNDAAEAPKAPTIQIDVAGLLQQILGNIKPPDK